ncbi:MAG: hypothetical protein RLZZ618_1949 [Pseudomonadota bacterium]|jgi:signal transduction histidine kinase
MLAPFLIGLVLMTALGVFSVNVLSSVRAFVGGESLWSKGQKDAQTHLEHYAITQRPEDYQLFQAALSVPLGDRIARTELERPRPNRELIRRGFLQGGNHPDDIEGMIDLYLRFRDVPTFAEAIRIWTEADDAIEELRALGEQIRFRVQAGQGGSADMQALLDQLPPLNKRLAVLGRDFSATLGVSSRDSRFVVLAATLLLAALLGGTGLWVLVLLMRRQHRAEQALRASNERWSLAANAASIGVFDWDVSRDRVRLDAHAARLMGFGDGDMDLPATQLTGGTVMPEDAPALQRALHEALDRRKPVVMRYRIVHADAGLRHIELNGHVTEEHRQRRMVGILRDVSDDFLAEKLQRDKETAERANREKGAFLSRVSHELRTPLNAVLGFTQLLQLDTTSPLSPVQSDRVQHVIDSSRQLLDLINDMLDVTTIDEGSLSLTARDVDLLPLLHTSRRQMESLAQAHGVRIRFEGPEGLVPVHADPRRLQQVFVHLLSNAVKYNRPKGEVLVECRRENGHARVSVVDTGPGLTAEQLTQLFQPFNRLGAEYSRVAGSGLGLVITQQLVKMMGGTLDVSSEVGRGSRFVMTLPLLPGAEPDPGQPVEADLAIPMQATLTSSVAPATE